MLRSQQGPVSSKASQGKARTVGLALGGGEGRGLAHLGVLFVLERESLPVHAIAGSSMGAIVGALYALSPCGDLAALTRLILEECVALSSRLILMCTPEDPPK